MEEVNRLRPEKNVFSIVKPLQLTGACAVVYPKTTLTLVSDLIGLSRQRLD